MSPTSIIDNITNYNMPYREINQNNNNNQLPEITNNSNFLNNVNYNNKNYNINKNNININNYSSELNGLFDFFINPLKKIIVNLKKDIKDKEKKIKEIEDKIEEIENKCSVCFTNKANIIFIPCGHLCMCNECNDICSQYNISLCPICRSNGTRYDVYV